MEASMSPSLLNAGRTTHLKIVAVALVAGIAVVAVGIKPGPPISQQPASGPTPSSRLGSL